MARSSLSTIEPWLGALWEAQGTDLLLTADSAPLIRVAGELQALDHPPLTAGDTERIVGELLPAALRAELDTTTNVDFSFGWEGKARLRANAFRQRDTFAVAVRMIPSKIPSLDEIGLPEPARRLAALPRGLVLVTGPTGAGKSTTLASLVDHINSTRAVHVLTVEDPIEYVHVHHRSAVNQREVGSDARSFPDALRAALREDPDVLLVGEMRDLESMQMAITMAETGHLVFATLHTNDAATALDRIIDVFPPESQTQIRVQLASSLAAVIAQRLVPRADGGLVAAYEVLLASHAVRNLVRDGRTNQLRNVIATSQREGMQTLEESLSALVAAGTVDHETAVAHSLYPKEVARRPAATATDGEPGDGEGEGGAEGAGDAKPAEQKRRFRRG